MFSCEFCEIVKNAFFIGYLETTASYPCENNKPIFFLHQPAASYLTRGCREEFWTQVSLIFVLFTWLINKSSVFKLIFNQEEA